MTVMRNIFAQTVTCLNYPGFVNFVFIEQVCLNRGILLSQHSDSQNV